MTKKMQYFEGTIVAGSKGICGDPNGCLMANQLRNEHGVTRPNVGTQYITFRYNGLNYKIPTPAAVALMIREWDRTAQDGDIHVLTADVHYKLPVTGKTVQVTEPKLMDEAVKQQLHRVKVDKPRNPRDLTNSKKRRRVS